MRITSVGTETATSRLVAPYFGTSTFIWANLIGITLTFLAIGYWIGGRTADRYPRAWLLYAWCRRCDDIADGQEFGGRLGDPQDAENRIQAIRVLTRRALDGQPTADPAFDAFGQVAQEAGLTLDMAEDVIAGFELDAAGWRPRTEADLLRYCYHVAGAVGVMMARVMGVPADDTETLDRACDLGLAFQLCNIARDVWEDDAAGRCYLPEEWLAEADIPPGQHMKPMYRAALVPLVARLLDLAEAHEAAGRYGAGELDFGPWQQIYYAEFDGQRAKRVIVKVMGE